MTVAPHHSHLPALSNGTAAAAHACLVPASPVHLLASYFLPSVEEGLIHQEVAPERGLYELWASCRGYDRQLGMGAEDVH